MELSVTWKIALRVWWAYFWRAILGTLALMFVLLICNYVVNSMAVSPIFITIILGLATCFFSVALNLLVVKQILNKNYGNFRLSVVLNESNAK